MRPASENEARRELIARARAMNAAGINVGKAGNLSMRWSRSAAEGCLITPSALPYDALEPDDIVWLPLDQVDVGQDPGSDAGSDAESYAGSEPGRDIQRGDRRDPPPRFDGRRKPSSEWRLHRDLLASRPDIGAVLHAHGPESSALACSARIQREGIPAFHYMVAVAGGADIRCAPYALFGSRELSEAAGTALAGRRACLLANHGLVVAAADPAAALALAVDVEGLCGQYRRLLTLGDPVLLDADQMAAVIEAFAGYGR